MKWFESIYVTLFITLCGYAYTYAQPAGPGGVTGPVWWAATHAEGTEKPVWLNPRDSVVVFDDRSGLENTSWINFNPALEFGTGRESIRVLLDQPYLSRTTIFTVYYPRDSVEERDIWHLTIADSTRLLLTTHRMADLAEWKFMNFVDNRKKRPLLHTYLQHRAADGSPGTDTRITFGGLPADRALPILPFEGLIPESIVFDRVLSPPERLRVESYLAIRYGLTLSPAIYLSAAGDTIWHGTRFPAFCHRIAGLGRDDASGLYQRQAASSYDPNLLAIAAGRIAESNLANNSAWPDRSFLIWGDNGAELVPARPEPGRPLMLRRQWRVEVSGAIRHQPTEVRVNAARLPEPASPEDIYWLVVDRSGSGAYPAGAVDYYPAAHPPDSGFVHFREVGWDPDGSGADLFTFATGPEMRAVFWMKPPHCQPQQYGTLQARVIGGQPPYLVQLRSHDGQTSLQWSSETGILKEVAQISPGEYQVRVRDAYRREYFETFFVQSADAPASALTDRYILPPGGVLRLDAGQGLSDPSLRFRWRRPDGAEFFFPVLEVKSPGIYRLEVSREGCVSRQDITVLAAAADPFRRIALFPNPTSGGYFQMRIELDRPGDVDLTVFNATGKQLLQVPFRGQPVYTYEGQIEVDGVYFFRIEAGEFVTNRKLIVH